MWDAFHVHFLWWTGARTERTKTLCLAPKEERHNTKNELKWKSITLLLVIVMVWDNLICSTVPTVLENIIFLNNKSIIQNWFPTQLLILLNCRFTYIHWYPYSWTFNSVVLFSVYFVLYWIFTSCWTKSPFGINESIFSFFFL